MANSGMRMQSRPSRSRDRADQASPSGSAARTASPIRDTTNARCRPVSGPTSSVPSTTSTRPSLPASAEIGVLGPRALVVEHGMVHGRHLSVVGPDGRS